MHNVLKPVISKGIALSLINLASMISTIIAYIFIAQLGSEALAASALINISFLTAQATLGTVLYAVAILISEKRALNDLIGIQTILFNGLIIALVLGFCGFLILSNLPKLISLFPINKSIISLTRNFFYFAGIAFLPALVNVLFAQYYIGIGESSKALLIMITTAAIKIVVCYALILGKFGFEQYGITGFGFALLFSNSIVCLWLLLLLTTTKKLRIVYKLNELGPLLKIGLPIGFQFGGELVALAFSTYLFATFGIAVLAAWQIISQYALFVSMIELGIAQALSILSAQASAKSEFLSIRNYQRLAIKMSIYFFFLLLVLFGLMPKYFMRPYIDPYMSGNNEIVFYAQIFMWLSIIIFPSEAIRSMCAGILRGLKQSYIPMRIGLICLWLVAIPLGYFIGIYDTFGAIGFRVGFAVGLLLASFLTYTALYKLLSRNQLS